MTLLHAADEGSKTTTEDTRSIFLQPQIESLNVWVCVGNATSYCMTSRLT